MKIISGRFNCLMQLALILGRRAPCDKVMRSFVIELLDPTMKLSIATLFLALLISGAFNTFLLSASGFANSGLTYSLTVIL